VVDHFDTLTKLLQEFEKGMAFKQGGLEALIKAKQAKSVCTVELDSGIQISGKVVDYLKNEGSQIPFFIRFDGFTQLSHHDRELPGQGPDYHSHGYSTPLGCLANGLCLHEQDSQILDQIFIPGQSTTLEFESGIRLEGVFIQRNEKLVFTFQNCKISKGDQILYDPSWGAFDLISGSKIMSVFGGPADRENFMMKTGEIKKPKILSKSNLTDSNRDLNKLYAVIREFRDSHTFSFKNLNEVYQKLTTLAPQDWLLRLELLELIHQLPPKQDRDDFSSQIQSDLASIAQTSKEIQDMISRGLKLLPSRSGGATS
jgi:phenylalanine-4-hydroxylase